jgi:ornithine cyclodeaminase/alanine dehydrogenase-like protein (mu-crystallin family)
MADDDVLILGPADVVALLEPGALLDALADAFAAAARGEVAAPPRSELRVGAAAGMLVMPGHRPGGDVVVKHVGLFPDNPGRGLPHHPATICAFDETTGRLTAVLDATELTAARTAGAAALSVRLAARAGARVAAVIGAGPVAAAHLAILPAVRELAELRVASRRPEQAAGLAAAHGARAVASVQEAVRGADVVCLCTSASEPVLAPEWLAPGAHVSSIGFHPPGGELPPELARGGRLLVETRDAFAAPPAGCAELAGIDPSTAAELGEVVLGERPARVSDDELTVYKSMGTVVEDLAAAQLVIRRARERGARTARTTAG